MRTKIVVKIKVNKFVRFYKPILCIIFLLLVLDLFSTHFFAARIGIQFEGNPLSKSLIQNFKGFGYILSGMIFLLSYIVWLVVIRYLYNPKHITDRKLKKVSRVFFTIFCAFLPALQVRAIIFNFLAGVI